MVYDRQPSRDNDYGNWHESSSFSNTRGNSLPSSSYKDPEMIAYGAELRSADSFAGDALQSVTLLRNGESAPPIEKLRKHFTQKQADYWAAKHLEWFDSLPVFELGEETERNEKHKESRQNQK